MIPHFFSRLQGLVASDKNQCQIQLVSEEIRRVTGVPEVAVVSGALTARGLASGEFTEVTLGSTCKTATDEVKKLLEVSQELFGF